MIKIYQTADNFDTFKALQEVASFDDFPIKSPDSLIDDFANAIRGYNFKDMDSILKTAKELPGGDECNVQPYMEKVIKD